jgi:hypothetical protein
VYSPSIGGYYTTFVTLIGLVLVIAAGIGLEGRASSLPPSCLATVPLFRVSFILTVINLNS